MQYYKLDNYFQSAYLSGGGVIFASPYMASQKPLLVTILKTCNPKSIKPTDYKRSKVINNDFNFTSNNLNLMRKAPEMCWFSPLQGLRFKQNVFEHYKLQIVTNR